MRSRLEICLYLGCVSAGSLAASDDPFVGKWKFNSTQIKMTGTRQVIQDLGGNSYKFAFGADSVAIVADGSDQPVKYGGTYSLKESGPNSWISPKEWEAPRGLQRTARHLITRVLTWRTRIVQWHAGLLLVQ